MKITYHFSGFTLACDTRTGAAHTCYPNGKCSMREVVPEDSEHAQALGISPADHARCHELAHHLVGSLFFMGTEQVHPGKPRHSCAIIYHDAHQLPMPQQADLAEWWITAIQYLSYRKPMRQAEDWGAVIDMQKAGFDVYAAADKLQKLMRLQAVEGVTITTAHEMPTGRLHDAEAAY